MYSVWLALLLWGLFIIVFLEVRMSQTREEVTQELRLMKAKVEKARAENAVKFKRLEDAIADAGFSDAEMDEALADLKTSVQGADDDNPDAEEQGGGEGERP